eukprot:scaffold46879_cov168-Amphora_coffeaeformis.AAC.1
MMRRIEIQRLKGLLGNNLTTAVHLSFTLDKQVRVVACRLQILLRHNFGNDALHGQGQRFVALFVTTRFGRTLVQGQFEGFVGTAFIVSFLFFFTLQVLEQDTQVEHESNTFWLHGFGNAQRRRRRRRRRCSGDDVFGKSVHVKKMDESMMQKALTGEMD